MAALRPNPTTSGVELANWLGLRLVVLAIGSLYAWSVLSSLLSSLVGPDSVLVAALVVAAVALWIALQLWFEATTVLIETTLESLSED
ncbi:hypothetical protein [Natrarchaeobaculum aegyptiacum]|uniref:DUF4282 domain-containing protein n=1 Tax=Natrarchaeobaculum aegyptiacum TaxID=745377 RepID=A0A2Z2I0C3_9EURY|nr:hypothetical protein [Natrarchaeobaculum aegyptiacum]ARS89588.1 hypothetical protein B1756_07445 [Natrarchaeobaculum aegyptiacum]